MKIWKENLVSDRNGLINWLNTWLSCHHVWVHCSSSAAEKERKPLAETPKHQSSMSQRLVSARRVLLYLLSFSHLLSFCCELPISAISEMSFFFFFIDPPWGWGILGLLISRENLTGQKGIKHVLWSLLPDIIYKIKQNICMTTAAISISCMVTRLFLWSECTTGKHEWQIILRQQ